jgi:hypothetical protein
MMFYHAYKRAVERTKKKNQSNKTEYIIKYLKYNKTLWEIIKKLTFIF